MHILNESEDGTDHHSHLVRCFCSAALAIPGLSVWKGVGKGFLLLFCFFVKCSASARGIMQYKTLRRKFRP